MVEHVNDCMTVRNHLVYVALGETVPDKQVVDKLLNVDRELSYLRPMLFRAPIDRIVPGLTDGCSYPYQDRQHQNQHGNAGRGRFQLRHPLGEVCYCGGTSSYGRGERCSRRGGASVL